MFGSIVVYPRSRKDHFKRYLSYAFEVFPPTYARFSNVFSLIFLSNLNYLFVSFFIRFSMIFAGGRSPPPKKYFLLLFGFPFIDSSFRMFLPLLRAIRQRSSKSVSLFGVRVFRPYWLPALPAGGLRTSSHAPLLVLIRFVEALGASLVRHLRELRSLGGLKWTRTTDLVLIRHAL